MTKIGAMIETWAQAERDQLALWVPVMFGIGIAAWFVLPDPRAWCAVALLVAGIGMAAVTGMGAGRVARSVGIAAFLVLAGLAIAWARAESVRAPVLARPMTVDLTAVVEASDRLAARRIVRLMLKPMAAADGRARGVVLPPRIRVSLDEEDAPAGLGPARGSGCVPA
ncbi:hypothetical protein P0F65_04395 [Sphingomonas sp. I4]